MISQAAVKYNSIYRQKYCKKRHFGGIMKLHCSPVPEYYICARKVFAVGEEHVTRIYGRSVLILMLSGNLRFLEGGEQISLTKGEFYIQRQRILQEGLPLDDPPVYYYIEFNGHFSSEGALPLRGRFDSNIITPLFEEMLRSGNGFFKNAQMNRIFAMLSGEYESNGSTAHLIKRYIDSNYASPLALEDIAGHFGYSQDHITRLFKKELGITPHKYLTEVRIRQAVWLLQNTDIAVERISAAVGFSDFSVFWRAFKKKYALSPREIRHSGGSPIAEVN